MLHFSDRARFDEHQFSLPSQASRSLIELSPAGPWPRYLRRHYGGHCCAATCDGICDRLWSATPGGSDYGHRGRVSDLCPGWIVGTDRRPCGRIHRGGLQHCRALRYCQSDDCHDLCGHADDCDWSVALGWSGAIDSGLDSDWVYQWDCGADWAVSD